MDASLFLDGVGAKSGGNEPARSQCVLRFKIMSRDLLEVKKTLVPMVSSEEKLDAYSVQFDERPIY